MKEKSLSVLFVTGIFYPDVGGPAIHVCRFAEHLTKKGHKVHIITYTKNTKKDTFSFPVSRISFGPKLFRWSVFFITVLLYTPFYKIIYVHDLTAAGVPGVFAAKIFRKKVLLRNAGDQLWERAAESGKTKLSFLEYYKAKTYKKDYPIAARLVCFVLQNLNIYITASNLLKNIHTKHFDILDEKVIVLPNPMQQKKHKSREIHEPFPVFIFGGRFIPYKNLLLTIQAFALCFEKYKKGKLLLIGKGPERKKLEDEIHKFNLQEHIEIISPVSHEKLAEYIRKAHVGLAPALTEFNPNFALECISQGLPVLISRENGLTPALSEEFLPDVTSPEIFAQKMFQFFDEDTYNKLQKKITALPSGISWDEYLEKQYAIITHL